MTYAKTQVFDSELQDLAAFAKALSHPARLMILRFLSERKQCFSGDISDEVPLSRTTVSQHLRELKKVGLIQGTVEGTRICYCIDPEVFQGCTKLFGSFLDETKPSGCC